MVHSRKRSRRPIVAALLLLLLLLSTLYLAGFVGNPLNEVAYGYAVQPCHMSVDERALLEKLLFLVAGILAKRQVPYWLDYGTLLGQARHGEIMSWEKDLDLAMLEFDSVYINSVLFTFDLERVGLAKHGHTVTYAEYIGDVRQGNGESVLVKLEFFVYKVLFSDGSSRHTKNPSPPPPPPPPSPATTTLSPTMNNSGYFRGVALPMPTAAAGSKSSRGGGGDCILQTLNSKWFRRSLPLPCSSTVMRRDLVPGNDKDKSWAAQLLNQVIRWQSPSEIPTVHVFPLEWSTMRISSSSINHPDPNSNPKNDSATNTGGSLGGADAMFINVSVPAHHDKYLSMLYGDDWRTVKKWKLRCHV